MPFKNPISSRVGDDMPFGRFGAGHVRSGAYFGINRSILKGMVSSFPICLIQSYSIKSLEIENRSKLDAKIFKIYA